MSDVVRDVLEYHQMNNLDHAHLLAVKRNAMLWECMREYVGFASNHWDNFWAWMKKEHEDLLL